MGSTLDDGFDLRSFGLGDERFFCHDFGDEFVDVGIGGEVEKVDALGLHFAIAAHVFESDAWRVVADQYLLQLHQIYQLLCGFKSSMLTIRREGRSA